MRQNTTADRGNAASRGSEHAFQRARTAVSIGTPVFNGEKSRCEALDSLLAQIFTGFEPIISDNASSNSAAAICRAGRGGSDMCVSPKIWVQRLISRERKVVHEFDDYSPHL
jgi:hypothetical protein